MSQLPSSWVEIELGDAVDYGRTSKAEPTEIPDDAWLLELEDIEKDTSRLLVRVLFGERRSKSSKNRFSTGDVLYGKLRPYLNKVIRADREGFCTTEIVPLKANPMVDGGYLFHWVRHPRFQDYVTKVSHGLNMPRLGTDAGRQAPFVLAPIQEQRRIARKLDILHSKIDACCKRLDKVPQILKKFWEAVLESAVSGRLTEDWRGKNPDTLPWAEFLDQNPPEHPEGYTRLSKQSFHIVRVEHSAESLPETWAVRTIGDLYQSKALVDFADGNHGSMYPRKEDFGTHGAIFLTAQQIDERHKVNIAGYPKLRQEKANQLTKGWALDGDVLLTHNATVGRVALLEGVGQPVLLGTSVTFYRFNTNHVDPRFACAVFSSRFFQSQLASVMEQTTRNQVPITKQVSLHFVCPPIVEQREIARRLDELFALANSLQLRYQDATVAAEKLTPSVLAKAFRGELTPRDTNDEPAGVMLERARAAGSAN